MVDQFSPSFHLNVATDLVEAVLNGEAVLSPLMRVLIWFMPL